MFFLKDERKQKYFMDIIGVIKQKRVLIKNLFLYGVIGGLAAVADLGVFWVLHSHLGVNKFIANLFSMHIGMFISFSLNAWINFKKTDKIFKRFVTYYVIILCGMALSSFILWVGGIFIQSEIIVKAISIIIVSSLQFIFNKIFTFNL